MDTIAKIRAEIKKLQDIFVETAQGMETEDEATVYSMCAVEFGDELLSFLDTLGAETSYNTLQYTPSPFVNIGDVARVQFASHAKVFDKKRKAVFDWEQFKEVAGIFYGFGKKDSIEESERPEPYNPVYDEAYLNEKIKKATESWKGVDVDAMLAECRGYDEEQPEKPMQDGLEEEMEKFGERWPYPASFDGYDKDWVDELAEECAKHFYELGKKDVKAKMMEGTVECDAEVCKLVDRVWVTPTDEKKFHQDVYDNFKAGDKVRIIIVKEDGQ